MTATSSPAEPPESTLAAVLRETQADYVLDGSPEAVAIARRATAARIAHLEAALAAAEARLRAVEALADEWGAHPEPPDEDYEGTTEGHWAFGEYLATRGCGRDLRAVLATPPQPAPQEPPC